MNIRSFDWDERNEEHIAEHGVETLEVEDAMLFRRPLHVRDSRGKQRIAF